MLAGERPVRETQASPAGFRYDTALIKEDPGRLLAEYLRRPGKVSGSRLVWDCPRCGKPKLSLFRTKGAVGCLNAGCEVEGETDVIGVIASLEGLQTRGEDFRRVCALCYRLLSIPDPTAAPARPSSTPEPEHAEAEPDPAPDETENVADGPGTREPEPDDSPATDEEEDAGFDAYDRWYALLGGHSGSAVLADRPQPYRPRDAVSPVPGAFFADEAESHWACLAGVAAALVFWYYVGASEGWLAGGVRFLPSLPDPLTVVYGLPFALLFGATVGALWLLRARSRRLAARRHLLGEERR